MTLVVVTKWAKPPAEQYAALAELFAMEVPDLRLLLAGPLPLVCSRVDGEDAKMLVLALRSMNHGAIAFPLADLPSHDELYSPRTYSFEERTFLTELPASEGLRIAYANITALVRARFAQSSETTTVSTKKKFSMGRALATGGLVMRKKVSEDTRQRQVFAGEVLFVVSAEGQKWVCLRENRLRHQGLGSRIAPTSIENFATLVEALRAAAPHTLYDDRLMRQRRRTTLALGSARERTSSNELEKYTAAALIVRAHLEHQL